MVGLELRAVRAHTGIVAALSRELAHLHLGQARAQRLGQELEVFGVLVLGSRRSRRFRRDDATVRRGGRGVARLCGRAESKSHRQG